MIELTDAAILKAIERTTTPNPNNIRLGVTGGGCAGHEYVIEYADTINDDDTLIHPELWESIKDLENDFISFKQNDKRGNLRLKGDVRYQKIDSHNFILTKELIGDTRWDSSKYEADGLFAVECFNKSKSYIKVDKVLSIYNQLR